MTSMGEAQDYPDLEQLLDVVDVGDAVSSSSAKNIEDDSEEFESFADYAGSHHLSYELQLEEEKEKLNRENESGLLEALKQTMDNYQSASDDVFSVLGSISSRWNQPLGSGGIEIQQLSDPPLINVTTSSSLSEVFIPGDGTIAVPSEMSANFLTSDIVTASSSDESMLKQLLLNPIDDYPKEIDGNLKRSKDAVAEQIVPKGSVGRDNNNKQNRKIKTKNKVAKKPFTELLKHLESPNSVTAEETKPKTRMLNVKTYMHKYGSAPPSRISSPISDLPTKPSRRVQASKSLPTSAQPASAISAAKSATGKTFAVKKASQVVKSKPVAKIPTTTVTSTLEQEKMIVAPDMNSLLDMFENERLSPVKTDGNKKAVLDKRRGTVLINPLPKKRARPCNEDSSKKNAESLSKSDANKLCTEKPSTDHDYCQRESSLSCPADEVFVADVQTHPTADEPLAVVPNVTFTTKSQATGKVLKWQEYLDRHRSGMKSEPNSPTTSPKIRRGSAVAVNNFMITENAIEVKQKQVTKPMSPLIEPIVAAKLQQTKTKPIITLQEFETYLANLQNNQQVVKTTASTVSTFTTSSCPVVESSRPVSSNATVAVSLACRQPVIQQSVPVVTPQPFIKIHSGGKVHTAAVTSSQANVMNSAPLYMIRIPPKCNSPTLTALTSTVKTAVKQSIPTIVTALPAQVIAAPNVSDSVSKDESLQDPRTATKVKPKSIPGTLKSIPRAKWCHRKQASSNRPKTAAATNNKSSSKSTTRFKLTTSQKDGFSANSIILSSAPQELNEILKRLVAQQQKLQSKPKDEESLKKQQQETLTQLLAAIYKCDSKGSSLASTSITSSPTISIPTVQTKTFTSSSSCTTKTAKKSAVPSPLSLIHEIKQNMNKKNAASKCASSHHHADGSQSAPTSPKHQIKPLQIVSISAQDAQNHNGSSLSCSQAHRQLRPSSVTLTSTTQENTSQREEECATNTTQSATILPKQYELPTEPAARHQAVHSGSSPKVKPIKTSSSVNEVSAVCTIQGDAKVVKSTKTVTTLQVPIVVKQPVPQLNQQTSEVTLQVIVRKVVEDLCDRVCSNPNNAAQNSVKDESNKTSLNTRPDDVDLTLHHDKNTHDTVITDSKAEKDLTSRKSEQNRAELKNDQDLEEGEISDCNVNDHYYNKLPAYLYSGKLLSSDVLPQDDFPACENVQNDGDIKVLLRPSSDPGIVTVQSKSDVEDDIGYNKLPHYLSSGKLGPRSGHAHQDALSGAQQHRGLSFSTKKIKYTSEGTVIDPEETFYSRLPSYYNYGRTHIVDTVTEPPDEPDDTVTQESLVRHDEERRKARQEKKKRKKRKKKRRKTDKRLDGDRILYSKIPEYLTSGRKTLAPQRSTPDRYYSTSHSDFSDSDRGRSPPYVRRSRSPRRRNSYCSSASRSRSRSPRRSWRNERGRRRSDYRSRSRSSDRFGYSSDSDDRMRVSRRRRRSSSYDSDPEYYRRKRRETSRDLMNQAIQQRRVMYVGSICDSTTKRQLHNRFEAFGEIEDVTLYFRRGRDNYAFVMFRHTCDTFAAIEHGNDGDVLPKYTLCFGGRRQFCLNDYADLDNEKENPTAKDNDDLDFDTLLAQAKRR